MVTTRRQSKDFFVPIQLPPFTRVKRRRRKNDTATPETTNTTQPLSQPLAKRRKKVKSTAKIVPSSSAPAVPPLASPSRQANGLLTAKATHKTRKERAQGKNSSIIEKTRADLASTRKPAGVDLTSSDSSDDEPTQRSQPVASQHSDDDTDSRYTLSSNRRGKARIPVAPAERRTAELKFDEDGLEEVDKADAAVADATMRTLNQVERPGPLPWQPINGSNANMTGRAGALETAQQSKDRTTRWNPAQPHRVPSRAVMFTTAEAIAALSLYKDGTMSVPAEIDPQSRQPYTSVQTGEVLSYPVKGTYHLGALGRYGINTTPPPPFSLTVPLSEFSLIEQTRDTSMAEPSRYGIGFASTTAVQPQAYAARRPNNYCFTFGRYRGRRMDSLPISYLRAIFNSDEYHNDPKMRQAFVDLYPKGLYESEVDSYTFEKGGFKGKRLDEVPKAYVWTLLRENKKKGLTDGGEKAKARLQKALDAWEQRQLDLTKD
ncbi:hypothetical protein C7974DRAFT_408641 [Boeremia exigua]|uniref:uncharacterized protein n=1 Tax=Boeremia exigua TaxID=749465 RepID=UPI001E8E23CE|nr:uncharacterized protein C7974DRAFT_408641 [Boeremia exigua]KAH6642052.1 hypothetical protein C7974DRAFT_408641 [Boeremia exigua]